jgi:hypothetical protein
MIGIHHSTAILLGNLVIVIFWALVIYFGIAVLQRLAEISRSLRRIEQKLAGYTTPEHPPPPASNAAEPGNDGTAAGDA